MATTIEAPFAYIRELADFEFPTATQERLQALMERNNEGTLTSGEESDLRALVELSERIALIRGRARELLQKLSG